MTWPRWDAYARVDAYKPWVDADAASYATLTSTEALDWEAIVAAWDTAQATHWSAWQLIVAQSDTLLAGAAGAAEIAYTQAVSTALVTQVHDAADAEEGYAIAVANADHAYAVGAANLAFGQMSGLYGGPYTDYQQMLAAATLAHDTDVVTENAAYQDTLADEQEIQQNALDQAAWDDLVAQADADRNLALGEDPQENAYGQSEFTAAVAASALTRRGGTAAAAQSRAQNMAGHRETWNATVGDHDLTAADAYNTAETDWAAAIRDEAIEYATALHGLEVTYVTTIAAASGGLQGSLATYDAEFAYAEVKANAVYEIAVDAALNTDRETISDARGDYETALYADHLADKLAAKNGAPADILDLATYQHAVAQADHQWSIDVGAALVTYHDALTTANEDMAYSMYGESSDPIFLGAELARAGTLKVAAIANGVVVGNAQGGLEAAAGTASADLSLDYAIASANYQYAIATGDASYLYGQSLPGGGHTASLALSDNTYRLNMAGAMVTWTSTVAPAKGQLHIDDYSSSAWQTYNAAEQAATDARAAEELGYAIGRAQDVGDAQVARATAIGDAYVAYVTAIAGAQTAYAADMATARTAFTAGYVTAEKAWYDSYSQAEAGYVAGLAVLERDWIATTGAADIALQTAVGTATGTATTAQVSAEADFQTSVAVDNASTVSAWAAIEQTSEADFKAAYAQAYSDWITALAPDNVTFVTAGAQITADHDGATVQSLVDWNNDMADTMVQFALDNTLDLTAYIRDGGYAQGDFRTAQNATQNALDGARATADAVLMIARAEVARLRMINDTDVETDYQVDVFSGDPLADDYRYIAEANNNPDYEQMLADAQRDWTLAIIGAALAYEQSSAANWETMVNTLATHQNTYDVATAADQQVFENSAATAEAAFSTAAIAAENQYDIDAATALADFRSADLAEAAAALGTFATTLSTPWANFQAELAGVMSAWWDNTQKQKYLDWIDDANADVNQYQGAFTLAYGALSASYAAENETLGVAISGAAKGFHWSVAAADSTLAQALAQHEADYQTAPAGPRRDERVGLAGAARDLANGEDPLGNPFTQTDYDNAVASLTGARSVAISSAEQAYAVGMAEAQGDYRIALAQAKYDYVFTAGPAYVTWFDATGDADVLFAQSESPARAQLAIDIANLDEAYFTDAATTLAAELNGLAQNSPSPWATYAADVAAADEDRLSDVLAEGTVFANTLANADKDFEIAAVQAVDVLLAALAQAGVDRSLTLAQAEIDQALADKSAAVALASAGASDELLPVEQLASPFSYEQTGLTAATVDDFFTLPAGDASSNFSEEMFQTKAEDDHATPPTAQLLSGDTLDERTMNGGSNPAAQEPAQNEAQGAKVTKENRVTLGEDDPIPVYWEEIKGFRKEKVDPNEFDPPREKVWDVFVGHDKAGQEIWQRVEVVPGKRPVGAARCACECSKGDDEAHEAGGGDTTLVSVRTVNGYKVFDIGGHHGIPVEVWAATGFEGEVFEIWDVEGARIMQPEGTGHNNLGHGAKRGYTARVRSLLDDELEKYIAKHGKNGQLTLDQQKDFARKFRKKIINMPKNTYIGGFNDAVKRGGIAEVDKWIDEVGKKLPRARLRARVSIRGTLRLGGGAMCLLNAVDTAETIRDGVESLSGNYTIYVTYFFEDEGGEYYYTTRTNEWYIRVPIKVYVSGDKEGQHERVWWGEGWLKVKWKSIFDRPRIGPGDIDQPVA